MNKIRKKRDRKVEFNGKTYKSHLELAKEFGINYETLMRRLRKGWSVEEAVTKKREKEIQDFMVDAHKISFRKSPPRSYIVFVNGNRVGFEKLDKLVGIDKILEVAIPDKEFSSFLKNRFRYTNSLGVTFYSLNDFCRHYGLSYSSTRYRLMLGETLTEIEKENKRK